jgi:hypothetical protein
MGCYVTVMGCYVTAMGCYVTAMGKQALSGADGDFGVYSATMLHRKHAGKDVANPISSLFGVNQFANTSEAAFRRIIFLSQLAQALCIKTFGIISI